jgi:chaperonin cofactor prefoldin
MANKTNEVKFTQEEMDSIQEIRTEASQIFFNLGQLHIERRNVNEELNVREEQIEQRHDALVSKEKELYQKLNTKYGEGTLDPVSGTFIPNEKK